jgi:phospholipase A1
MRYILILLTLYSVAYTQPTKEIQKIKIEMVASLDDMNESEKRTISKIVRNDFNLQAYKENYFLPVSYIYSSELKDNGTHDSKDIETEFQVSVRYDFSSNLLGLEEIYSFGYTQRSWWQLYVQSAFFRESNYQPELFVTVPTYKTFLKDTFIKGFKMNAIHQSNGRGGEYERSWNRLSFSTFFLFKNIISELEFWYRTPDAEDYNPDLLHYMGYGELSFMLPYKKHLFKLKLRSNPAYQKSSMEFTYTHPIPAREENDLFFYFKSFNGYGESLINYNQNINKISIGVGISR